MEDYICHHGVKGMKWGIRKDRYKSSTISNKLKQKSNSVKSVIKKSTKKKTNIKKLSNEDLQRRVKRLELEKRYRDLKKDEISEGRKLVGGILKTSGKTLGVAVATYVGGRLINKAIGIEVVNVKKKK